MATPLQTATNARVSGCVNMLFMVVWAISCLYSLPLLYYSSLLNRHIVLHTICSQQHEEGRLTALIDS